MILITFELPGYFTITLALTTFDPSVNLTDMIDRAGPFSVARIVHVSINNLLRSH